MQIHYDLNDLGPFRNAIVTIGSFDGVHAGHQKILERLRQLARDIDGESILITFHPHPRLVLRPDSGGDNLRLLSTQQEKAELVERHGIDHLVFVPFTLAFAKQSPEEYVRDFLVRHFHPKRIVIGYDHKFGNRRKGDINLLKALGSEYGYEVEEISKQEVEKIAVSSTKIRQAISAGKISMANELLRHYYSLSGEVAHGQSLGKGIGFPTANLDIKNPHKLIPATGIYAVYVHYGGHRYDGMLYLGDRPTLEDHHNYVCEVNIFQFKKDIYGEQLRVEFVDWIRSDAKFHGLDTLRQQLVQDKAHTLARLGRESGITVSAKAEVAVVLLNFNGRDYLRDFLPQVLATTEGEATVYVADNHSKDDSVAFMENHFPDVRLIRMEKNWGFAEGYNKALSEIHADYYVLLNTDALPEPGWITPIIERMERDRTVAACQPKILAYHKKDHFEYAGASGGWVDHLGYSFCRGRIMDVTERDSGQYDESREVFWATGAALFVRADLFDALGGFDGSYFAHWEEIDLCWRLKRAGYKVVVKPESVVYHVGGGTLNATSPYKTYLNFRNSLITLFKNEPPARLRWLLPLRLCLDGLAGLLFLSQGQFRHIRSIVEAHWHFFGKISHYRKQKQAEREAIKKISIGSFNDSGRYARSILWQFYAKGRKSFGDLP